MNNNTDNKCVAGRGESVPSQVCWAQYRTVFSQCAGGQAGSQPCWWVLSVSSRVVVVSRLGQQSCCCCEQTRTTCLHSPLLSSPSRSSCSPSQLRTARTCRGKP